MREFEGLDEELKDVVPSGDDNAPTLSQDAESSVVGDLKLARNQPVQLVHARVYRELMDEAEVVQQYNECRADEQQGLDTSAEGAC